MEHFLFALTQISELGLLKLRVYLGSLVRRSMLELVAFILWEQLAWIGAIISTILCIWWKVEDQWWLT